MAETSLAGWDSKTFRADFPAMRKDLIVSDAWKDLIIYLSFAARFGSVTITLVDGEPSKLNEISRNVLVEKLSIIVPIEGE
jgi:hypothetical protein